MYLRVLLGCAHKLEGQFQLPNYTEVNKSVFIVTLCSVCSLDLKENRALFEEVMWSTIDKALVEAGSEIHIGQVF